MEIRTNDNGRVDNNDNDIEFRRYYVDNYRKEAIIQQIIEEIKHIEEIQFSFLHGSYLKEKSFRDIDIALYLKTVVTKDTGLDLCNNLCVKLTSKIGIPVDITLLNYASVSFCFYATQGKILTHQNLEDVYNYKEDIWIKYMDLYPMLRENLADMLSPTL